MESSIEAAQPGGISQPKPALAPKPRLTPKPFSLQKNTSIRSINAPKAYTETSKKTTQKTLPSPAKHVVTPDPKPISVSELNTKNQPKPTTESKTSPHGEDGVDSSVGKLDPAPKTAPPKETPKSESIQKDGVIQTNHKTSSDVTPDSEQKISKSKEDGSHAPVIQKPEESGSNDSSAADQKYRLGSVRKRLPAELTSKFESGGSCPPPLPKVTIPMTKSDTIKPESSDQEQNQITSEPSNKENDEDGLKEEYSGGGSIKRRISQLFDSSSRPEVTAKREEPEIINSTGGVKERIKNWVTETNSENEKKPQFVPRPRSRSFETPVAPAVEETPKVLPVEPPASVTLSSGTVDLPSKIFPAEKPKDTPTETPKGALTENNSLEGLVKASKENEQQKPSTSEVVLRNRSRSLSQTAADEQDSAASESPQRPLKRDKVKRRSVHFGTVERDDGGPPVPLGSDPDTSEEEEEEGEAPKEENSVSSQVGSFQKRSDEAQREEEDRLKHLEFEKRRRAEEHEQARIQNEEEQKEKAKQREEEERERRRQREVEERQKLRLLEEEEQERLRKKEEEERERQKRREKEELERQRLREEEERERQRKEELERVRLKEEERERERLKEEELEREMLIQREERDRDRQLELMLQRQREAEKDRARQEEERLKKELEERERERVMEEERLRKERERQRQREEEIERERQIELMLQQRREEERERAKQEEERLKQEQEERERVRLREEKRLEEERERLREERERQKQIEEEMERLKEERERLRQEEEEMERLKAERERQRLREEEMERLREERERQRQREEEMERLREERERERLREEEMEKLREERERQRQREEEMERLREERERQRQREEEMERLREERERQRQREEEMERLREERERLRQKEEEMERLKEEIEREKLRLGEKRLMEEEERERQRLREEAEEREQVRLRVLKEQQEKREAMERMREIEMERQREEERREVERRRQIEKEKMEELDRKMKEELERKRAQEVREQLRLEEEKERINRAGPGLISSGSDVNPLPSARNSESPVEVVYDDFSVKQPQMDVDFDDFSVKPKRWGSQAKTDTSPVIRRRWEDDPVEEQEVEELVPMEVNRWENKMPEQVERPDSSEPTLAPRSPGTQEESSSDGVQLLSIKYVGEEDVMERWEGEVEETRETEDTKDSKEDEQEAQVTSYVTTDEDKDTDALLDDEPIQQEEACEQPSETDSPQHISEGKEEEKEEEEADISPEVTDTTDLNREEEPAPFPESSTPLLDTRLQRSKAVLSKRRTRSRPSRVFRAGLFTPESPDWRTCDSTDEKEVKQKDSEEDEEPKSKKISSSSPSSQRVPMFPGLSPSALLAQLKRRTGGGGGTGGEETEEDKGRQEMEIQKEEKAAPSASQLSRSPRTASHMAGAARVLPPLGSADKGAAASPAWLKELKSKKRLSQHEGEA
ncbi:uncharacterized protein LOC141788327 [Halichoeres trimaculatus]|uniref:uncharacterized protein LOC141788327 n=1 Tax=Halichoeres trimaculatus TaxID=147232 RepID=UPI003D9DF9F5